MRAQMKLVFKEFAPIQDENYLEVFAPASNCVTVQFMRGMSMQLSWKSKWIDTRNARETIDLSVKLYVQ